MPDISRQLIEQINDARAAGTALEIVGRNSKSFYGREPAGEALQVGEHRGIVDYEPAELVLTVRAGTPLAEIEQALDEQGQRLAFEPPHFGGASIGGTLACNQSGPARAWMGSIRDMVLGLKLINGKGEHLRFGGQVMKNVAGYDVSRLQAGAMGCLGVITEISFKVLPGPAASHTLIIGGKEPGAAISIMNRLSARPLPVSGACWLAEEGVGRLYLRLEGARNAVHSAVEQLRQEFPESESLRADDNFWYRLREHELEFFDTQETLWRFSVGAARDLMPDVSADEWLIDWGGAQRWLRGSAYSLDDLNALLPAGAGEVSAFRRGDRRGEVSPELAVPVKSLHIRLKEAFDPDRLLNRGRLYSWL